MLLKRFDTLSLTKDDTFALKGIALILLLFHHIFYFSDYGFDDIVVFGKPAICTIAVGLCKFCVSLFVFLSGYGLTKVANDNGGIGNIIEFYKRRINKLFINYWCVWLLFVIPEWLFTKKSIIGTYGDHQIIKILFDLSGLSYAFGLEQWNSTWWFYSCIIILYLLFPLLYKMRKRPTLLILLAVLISLLENVPIIGVVQKYFGVFVLAILMTTYRITPPLLTGINTFSLTTLTLITCIMRIYLRYHPAYIDVILCYFVVLLYHNLKIQHSIKEAFIFLGKHSFNIFLFHTIIQRNLHSYLFYYSNPVFIFILFMSICVITSIIFEKTKSIIFCQSKK